ncbi:unnamed protein product [Lymnaea stagnalis]|uniref:TNFR-Cys domain-containing protein n=1 Tax=Lymnaea stagnalis TaxID=6523 RepID=A0AAV2H5H8_LYMST
MDVHDILCSPSGSLAVIRLGFWLSLFTWSLAWAQWTLTSDICPKGSYWNSNEMSCKKCDKGSYQSVEGSSYVRPTECTSCPNLTTTLIDGATLPRYCIFDCPLGTEYSFLNKHCTLCPVGQYRDASSQVCYYCPLGFTTINPGQQTCTRTLSTSPPTYDLTLVVDLGIKMLPCQNADHMKIVLETNVLFMMRRLRRRYPGLCGNDRCDNIRIDIIHVCDSLRGDETEASANMTISNLRSRLAENGYPDKVRDILSIIDGAFYDMTVISDNLLALPICYYTPGHSLNLDGICEQCSPGQFSNSKTYQCELCPKGTYSSTSVNDFCEQCPDGHTTKEVGSVLQAECDKEPTSDLVIIVSASVAGFVVIVIVIVIIVICKRRKESSRERREGRSSGGSGSQAIKSSQSKHRHRPTKRATSNQYSDPHLPVRPESHQAQGRQGHPPKIDSVYHIPSSAHNWDNESVHQYNRPGTNMDYVIPVDYNMPTVEQEPTYEELF